MTTRTPTFETLQQAIGYQFGDLSLLDVALTHSSFANESRAKRQECQSNERLEFLGDAVLQIYISEYLFKAYPRCAEGELTKMRQYLVCESTLARVANTFSLGSYLHLGRGEEQNGGRNRASILADAFESLLGAVYLDSRQKNQPFAREVLYHLMGEEIKRAATAHIDYKTQLQQFVQQDGGEVLSYETVEESGPAHDRFFRVEAKINSNTVGTGEGKTKREAEQNAARQALILFGLVSQE